MRNKNRLQKTSNGVENEDATRARNDVVSGLHNDGEGGVLDWDIPEDWIDPGTTNMLDVGGMNIKRQWRASFPTGPPRKKRRLSD